MEINDIINKSIKNGLSGGSAMVFQVSTFQLPVFLPGDVRVLKFQQRGHHDLLVHDLDLDNRLPKP